MVWRRWLRMNSRGLKFTALVVLGGLSLTVALHIKSVLHK